MNVSDNAQVKNLKVGKGNQTVTEQHAPEKFPTISKRYLDNYHVTLLKLYADLHRVQHDRDAIFFSIFFHIFCYVILKSSFVREPSVTKNI